MLNLSSLIDLTDNYDRASVWVSPGEILGFDDVPGVKLFAADSTSDGGVTFLVITGEDQPRVRNRVTFLAWPGTEALRSLARIYESF